MPNSGGRNMNSSEEVRGRVSADPPQVCRSAVSSITVGHFGCLIGAGNGENEEQEGEEKTCRHLK